MPPDPRDAAYLWDIVHAATNLMRVVQGKRFEDYVADEDLRMMVERRIEIIGEAAKRLSEAFRTENPGIPWRKIIGQRNVMAHNYDSIDHERIWSLLTGSIPQLLEQLQSIAPAPPLAKEGPEFTAG